MENAVVFILSGLVGILALEVFVAGIFANIRRRRGR
jgi:hypothetical protein